MTVYLASIIFAVAIGRVKLRDERDRLKPAPAALLALGVMVLLGLLGTAILG